MPANKYDRIKSKTIAFRLSPAEESQLNVAIALSGLQKQEYIIRKLLDKSIQVQGNCKVHRAVYDLLQEVLCELKRLNNADDANEILLSNIALITEVIDNLYVKSA